MDDSSSKYKNPTLPFVYNAPTCDVCGQPKVDVYQDEGIFCLECWRKRPASVSGKGPADPTNFGPNCVGCITTKNLANGTVTNPKLATPSVQSANIGAG